MREFLTHQNHCLHSSHQHSCCSSGSVSTHHDWIDKYQEQAVAAGVAVSLPSACMSFSAKQWYQLIIACGVFSAPQDLLTWAVIKQLRSQGFPETGEVILSVKEMTLAPSGGTIESIRSRPKGNPATKRRLHGPWALSPIQGVQINKKANWLGLRYDTYLGYLADSQYGATQDRAIVHRTWGLLDNGKIYGPHFNYSEYDSVTSIFTGILKLLNVYLMVAALSFGPAFALASRFLPKPGEGPDVEESRKQLVDIEALAVPSETRENHRGGRAYARFKYQGGNYPLTGDLLAQAAASILYERKFEGGYTAGFLTPAMLGDDFLERLRRIGVSIETSVV